MDDKFRYIRFSFDTDKFLHVMLILGKRTSQLDALKAAKLLYLIDRDHLRAHGRPVLGDHYVAMKDGPVPSQSYDILKNIRSGFEVSMPIHAERQSGWDYPVFVADAEPDLDFLSDTEIESIKKVIEEYGDKTGTELRALTHGHATWAESKENLREGADPIDYKLFFKEDFDYCRLAYEAMLLEQEDRDFAGGI